MDTNEIYDTLIIGGGPAGYTAALYAARAGLRCGIVEKMSPGGQMMLTQHIDNYPGFPEGIDGFTLSSALQKQAERFGAESRCETVTAAALRESPKRITTDLGELYAKTVIIATGAEARELGLSAERRLRGRGVSYCAECDGMFFRGKDVVVVGGGNSAAAEAVTLSRLARHVTLIHRRDTLRATAAERAILDRAENVRLRLNAAVEEIFGEERVSGVRLRDCISGESEMLVCDGVFISIGRNPVSALFAGQLTLRDGYIPIDLHMRTEIPGVFAAGDVRADAFRQIITAAADGAAAAHSAEEYLRSMG